MRELEILIDTLTTNMKLIDKKEGLELLSYLLAMALQEAEYRRGELRKK